MAAMPVPKLKLIYLDHHYWRAECSRLALHIGDVPFEDARLGYDDMYASGALTFGTFPALVVEGKGVLNQTQAIARYVGSVTGLYPADPFLAAKCDEAVDALSDVLLETPWATGSMRQVTEARDAIYGIVAIDVPAASAADMMRGRAVARQDDDRDELDDYSALVREMHG